MQHGSPLVRLTVICIAALALRPQLIGIGPLVPQIRSDFGMSFAEAGLLATIPLLCMGLFALTAPTVVAALGASRTIAGCLLLLAVSGALRGLAPSGLLLLVLTIPVLVKEWLPERAGAATGIYTTAIQVGSVVASGAAVPLALAFGGWRVPLELFAAAALLSLAAWLFLAERPTEPPHGFRRSALSPIALRDPVAWLLAAIFALTAVPYYGLGAWLPSAYVERGWSTLDAGSLFAAFALTGLPGSLIASFVADRGGSRRAHLVVSTVIVTASLIGLIVAPGLAWPCVLIGGGFLGAMFTIVMTLPLDVSRDATKVAPVVGLMMTVGYCLMALMPSLLGAVRDATGSFTVSLWMIVAACLPLLAACLLASPRRLAREG